MIQSETRETTVVVDTITDVICNGCGCPLKKADDVTSVDMQGWGKHDMDALRRHFYGMVEHTETGGYESTHLLDLTTYTFSLCEACLVQIMSAFKIPPAVRDLAGGDTDTWENDRMVWQEVQELREKR